MPINDKQQAFINEYIVNGHNATKAYKAAYPDNKTPEYSASRLLSNIKVREAIDRDLAKIGAEVGYTVEKCQEEYEQARLLAVELKQPSAVVSAITGKARLYALDKDSQANPDQPLPMTDKQLSECNRAANVVLADNKEQTV